MTIKRVTAIGTLFLAAALACFGQAASPAPFQPQYLLMAGVSYDYFGQQASAMTSLAVRATSIAGLPTYSVTSVETALAKTQSGVNNSGSLRSGVLQVVYQTGWLSVFVLGDAGITNSGVATLGNFTGAGGLAYDIGGRVTKGKSHIYIVPTIRLVTITATQVKPVYGLHFGTAF